MAYFGDAFVLEDAQGLAGRELAVQLAVLVQPQRDTAHTSGDGHRARMKADLSDRRQWLHQIGRLHCRGMQMIRLFTVRSSSVAPPTADLVARERHAAIMRKGQFEGIKPLNWPFIVCPRQDSNLRHPL